MISPLPLYAHPAMYGIEEEELSENEAPAHSEREGPEDMGEPLFTVPFHSSSSDVEDDSDCDESITEEHPCKVEREGNYKVRSVAHKKSSKKAFFIHITHSEALEHGK